MSHLVSFGLIFCSCLARTEIRIYLRDLMSKKTCRDKWLFKLQQRSQNRIGLFYMLHSLAYVIIDIFSLYVSWSFAFSNCSIHYTQLLLGKLFYLFLCCIFLNFEVLVRQDMFCFCYIGFVIYFNVKMRENMFVVTRMY